MVVDDDAAVLGLVTVWLGEGGYDVVALSSARAALVSLGEQAVDAIVTDIGMPDMSGIELLREVRRRELDVPVILLTGDPRLETAIEAIEFGVARYLVKPVSAGRLLAEVARAVRIGGLARLKREAVQVAGLPWEDPRSVQALSARFERALATVWPAFQPIVAWGERRIYAYEALLRCDEPGLTAAEDLLALADRLGRGRELGRVLRSRVAAVADTAPVDALLFVNLTPDDLLDDELLDPRAPLRAFASRVVLEVTERRPLGALGEIRRRVAELRRAGFRLAVDDLGAGYAGLSSLLQLDPEVVKVDMGLVRGVDADVARQRVIGSMVRLCDDLGMRTVIEGVQTVAERDMLVSLGCDLLQGYLFGRPGRSFGDPSYAD